MAEAPNADPSPPWMAGLVKRTGAVATYPRAPTRATCRAANPPYTGVNGQINGSNTITVTNTTTVNGSPSLR